MGKPAKKSSKRRAISRRGLSRLDWRDGLRMLSDKDYKDALLRRRDGTPGGMGMPAQPGIAPQLADMLVTRQMPDFEENDAKTIANFDKRIAMFAAILKDLDEQIAAEGKIRKEFGLPEAPTVDQDKETQG